MANDPRTHPRLRYVEAIPDPDNGRILLRDPTQLATGMLAVGQAHLTLITLLDGRRTRLEIQTENVRKTGDMLLSHELEEVLETSPPRSRRRSAPATPFSSAPAPSATGKKPAATTTPSASTTAPASTWTPRSGSSRTRARP